MAARYVVSSQEPGSKEGSQEGPCLSGENGQGRENGRQGGRVTRETVTRETDWCWACQGRYTGTWDKKDINLRGFFFKPEKKFVFMCGKGW